MAEFNAGHDKMPNMYEVLHAGLAKHVDHGVYKYIMKDMGGSKEVAFYAEEFTYKGESYMIMHPKAVIDKCSDPARTRGLLAEVFIHGLTGLESHHIKALSGGQ